MSSSVKQYFINSIIVFTLFLEYVLSKVVVEWLTLLRFIRMVPCSNLCLETGNSD
jgi:hypothetical protein